MLTTLRRSLARLTPESRRWLPTPAGCCECGTGGPYYTGTAPQVTRYLYENWAACSAHKLPNRRVLVDYGRDVVATFAQTDSDRARKLAERRAGWTCPLVDCHPAIGRPRMHTHATAKEG